MTSRAATRTVTTATRVAKGDQGGDNGGDQGGDNGGDQGGDNGGNGGDQGGAEHCVGPFDDDFVDINDVQANVANVQPGADASTGTFVSECGNNENKHQNTDNIIIAPGKVNGAEHLHDYVGNLDTTFASTDDSLAAADTTCTNGDLSTYFWPILRNRSADDDPLSASVKDENNIGTPVLPAQVKIEWRGNPTTKVVAAPRFLRLFSGDAKTITNGLGNARPTYTCSGFEDRITNKYPVCPDGSNVLSVHDFPGCWDGQNLDSANHRDHLAFADENSGACPDGFVAIPQLRVTLVYGDNLNDTPLGFAVDGFSTEEHDPASDHAGTINVMPDDLMAKAVDAINNGQGTDAGGDNGGDGGNGDGGNGGDEPQKIGPFDDDFVDINDVQANVANVQPGADASTGTFVSECGNNENKHQNTDNIIIAPGKVNGAEHLHDYVGNLDTTFASTDDSLAAADTTCTNGDLSTYFWPILRNRSADDDPLSASVKDENNIGTPVLPAQVKIEWRGNPTTKVVAAPRFLRLFSGDAKTITNGLGNARPTYTCSGFEDRITNKYPVCPDGSNVLSVHDFPGCWDGQNLDSANHRDHLAFADENSGACPDGFVAIPQLRVTLVYGDNLNDTPLGFAVDGFSTEEHDPASDHAGTINVMPDDLMAKAVDAINNGQQG